MHKHNYTKWIMKAEMKTCKIQSTYTCSYITANDIHISSEKRAINTHINCSHKSTAQYIVTWHILCLLQITNIYNRVTSLLLSVALVLVAITQFLRVTM